MDWIPIELNTPAERLVVALSLFDSGYTVRQRVRKDGDEAVIYIEYRRDGGA